jgi:hypothetical protein
MYEFVEKGSEGSYEKFIVFASNPKKPTSSGFDKGSLGVFLEKGTNVLPDAGTFDRQIMLGC